MGIVNVSSVTVASGSYLGISFIVGVELVLVFEGSMGAAKQCQRLLAERDLLNDSDCEGAISFENSDESKIEQCIAMFGIEVAE